MAAKWFNKGIHEVMSGNIDWASDPIKVMALDAFTINVDTQEFIDDISANEVSATGYTAGGSTLGSKAVTRDDTNDRTVFQAANVTWTITGSMSAQVFVIYKDTGTPATSPILGYDDKGSPQVRTDEDFVLEFPSTNVLIGRGV